MAYIKKMSKKCAVCEFKDECDKKRMEMLGCLELPKQNLAAAVSETSASDMAQPLVVKHDYRNVKIAEGMTVTVDLERLKKKLEEDLMESIRGGGFLQNGC